MQPTTVLETPLECSEQRRSTRGTWVSEFNTVEGSHQILVLTWDQDNLIRCADISPNKSGTGAPRLHFHFGNSGLVTISSRTCRPRLVRRSVTIVKWRPEGPLTATATVSGNRVSVACLNFWSPSWARKSPELRASSFGPHVPKASNSTTLGQDKDCALRASPVGKNM
jgi:hypothetical protein